MDGQVNPLTPAQLECMEDIHASGQYLLSLISEILDITKIESGKMDFPLEWFSLGQMLNPVKMQMIPNAQKKDLEIQYEVENEELLLYSCMLKLQQVLFNLLDNAVKFTPDRQQTCDSFHTTTGVKASEIHGQGSWDWHPYERQGTYFPEIYPSR